MKLKYLLSIFVFIVGIVIVTTIKNETRNVQKDIKKIDIELKNLRIDFREASLDYHFLTSPENISRMAQEYLEENFLPYKKSRIKLLHEENYHLSKIKEVKNEKIFKKKNINKELNSYPKLAKKFEVKKGYFESEDARNLRRTEKWLGLQVIKGLLGIPTFPVK